MECLKNVEDGIANFVASGETVDKYPLVIATQYNIPFLLKALNAVGTKVRKLFVYLCKSTIVTLWLSHYK